MTEMLNRAFERASRLPEEEQNEFAAFLLDELQAEDRWFELLSSSGGKLEELAEEARDEYRAGETEQFNPASE